MRALASPPQRRRPAACVILSIALLCGGCGSNTSVTSTSAPVGSGAASTGVGNYYFLPRARVRIKAEKADGDNNFTVTVSQFNEPDRSHRYFLKQENNAFFEDQLVLTVNDSGLLQTVNVDSEDKTSEIIEKVADTVVDAFKVASQTGVAALVAVEFKPFNYVFDPLDPEETEDIKQKMDTRGFVLGVKPDPIHSRRSARIEQTKNIAEKASITTTEHLSGNGVFYHPPIAVQLTINGMSGDGRLVERKTLRLPDPDRVAMLSMTRSALISKKTHVTFVNGDLSSVDYKKPSQALAAVSIPASIVHKAAEAIPAVVKIQDERATHGATQRKAELEAQAEVLKAQAALIEAKAALEAAKKKKASEE
jgi:hypothetical protein